MMRLFCFAALLVATLAPSFEAKADAVAGVYAFVHGNSDETEFLATWVDVAESEDLTSIDRSAILREWTNKIPSNSSKPIYIVIPKGSLGHRQEAQGLTKKLEGRGNQSVIIEMNSRTIDEFHKIYLNEPLTSAEPKPKNLEGILRNISRYHEDLTEEEKKLAMATFNIRAFETVVEESYMLGLGIPAAALVAVGKFAARFGLALGEESFRRTIDNFFADRNPYTDIAFRSVAEETAFRLLYHAFIVEILNAATSVVIGHDMFSMQPQIAGYLLTAGLAKSYFATIRNQVFSRTQNAKLNYYGALLTLVSLVPTAAALAALNGEYYWDFGLVQIPKLAIASAIPILMAAKITGKQPVTTVLRDLVGAGFQTVRIGGRLLWDTCELMRAAAFGGRQDTPEHP